MAVGYVVACVGNFRRPLRACSNILAPSALIFFPKSKPLVHVWMGEKEQAHLPVNNRCPEWHAESPPVRPATCVLVD